MKTIIKDAITNLCYKLGYYPPQRIMSVTQICKLIEDTPKTEVKEYHLLTFSKRIRNFILNKDYNQLLLFFVPEWDLANEQYEFVGKQGHGLGESSLSTFRKVEIKNEVLFEKVYFNSYADLHKIVWFQENMYPLLKDRIRIPKIKKIYRGDLISIVYFEYVNLKEFDDNQEFIQSAIELAKYFNTLSENNQAYIKQVLIADPLFDFRQHFLYKQTKEIAKNSLTKINLDLENLEKQVATSTLAISHGDLYKTNLFQENNLIDWDAFGFYPIGMEVAFLYQRLLEFGIIERNDFFNWLEINFRQAMTEEKWTEFERNALFFLYVFSQKILDDLHISILGNELAFRFALLNQRSN